MLRDHPAYAILPTTDLEELRRFYEQKLGFEPREETPAGIYYEAGSGTLFAITRQSGRASGTHTQLGFRVADIVAEVSELRSRGVKFEDYESPRTIDGIAEVPVGRAAWFADPDGNIIGIIEFSRAD